VGIDAAVSGIETKGYKIDAALSGIRAKFT
jgi:hypothetical protein